MLKFKIIGLNFMREKKRKVDLFIYRKIIKEMMKKMLNLLYILFDFSIKFQEQKANL